MNQDPGRFQNAGAGGKYPSPGFISNNYLNWFGQSHPPTNP
ncbi:MAG: hypothetical protein R2744_12030 [Bacteroidales bacterium]